MPAGFGLVINDQNEILLIQRGYGSRKGKWSLPGGNQDKGESLRRTAIRETREETGIRMGSVHLYYQGRNYPMEVWRGKRVGGHLRIQRRECLDAKWFQHDMLPHDRNLAFGPDKIAIGMWAREIQGSRREAAVRAAHYAAGVVFHPERLYFSTRHRARVWVGSPVGMSGGSGSWFPIDGLPDDDSLAFAIDVRAVEKWAGDNQGSRLISGGYQYHRWVSCENCRQHCRFVILDAVQ